MNAAPTPLELDEIAALARTGTPPVEYSLFSDTPCLVLNAAGRLAADESAQIADWLATLACPTVAVADEDADAAVVAACDVAVPDEETAQPVVEAAARNPVAATVLMQVLRVTETLSVSAGLTVESMAYATLQGGAEYAAWLKANRAASAFTPTDGGPAVIMARDGGTMRLALNRASNRNAMSVEMRDALVEALSLVNADDSIDRVSISGRGRCFSVGGDLTEFGTVPDAASGHLVRGLSVPGRFLAACAGRVSVHVHGACIGSGIEFPAFAGQMTATAKAHFQLPEVGMGLIPGAGGCLSIARRIGRQRLAWWALTGRRIRAARALEWGLIDAIVDAPAQQ